MTAAQMATLRELAEDLESIVQVVSTRDGDATARQHARAEAVRSALRVLTRLPQCPECGPTRIDDDGCCSGCGSDAVDPEGRP